MCAQVPALGGPRPRRPLQHRVVRATHLPFCPPNRPQARRVHPHDWGRSRIPQSRRRAQGAAQAQAAAIPEAQDQPEGRVGGGLHLRRSQYRGRMSLLTGRPHQQITDPPAPDTSQGYDPHPKINMGMAV